QRILALLDGSDSPVYSMSTHGENGIAAAGRAPVQARSSPTEQPGKTPAADRQFDPKRPPRPPHRPSGAQHVGCTPADRAEANYRRRRRAAGRKEYQKETGSFTGRGGTPTLDATRQYSLPTEQDKADALNPPHHRPLR